MSATISLKEIESKAYRSFFKDGIWDIYLGILLLAMGGGPALLSLGTSLIWAAILPLALAGLGMAIFVGGKRRLTVPRLGTVRFGPARKAGKKRAAVVFSFSAFVGVVLFALSWTGFARIAVLETIPLPALIFAANCIIIFGLAAYFLDFSRLYVYGLLYAAAFPLAIAAHQVSGIKHAFFLVYAIAAGPMLITGLVLLLRFIRDYPVATEPAMENNG